MKQNKDRVIKELESKIHLLEVENETLTAKAEENLLLNKAFEEINVHNDIDKLMLNTLENISILLNIPFSGLFDYVDKQFVNVSSYNLFSNEDAPEIFFNVSESIVNDINSQEFHVLSKIDKSFVLNFADGDFIAESVLLIPLDSEILKNRYFVFATDADKHDLIGRISWFKKLVRILSSKLDRIYYQTELEKLNKELEKEVQLRTIELHRQNQELLAAKEKAEESDRLKTAFLQNISHEIRTPVNAIIGFSDLLKENYENKKKLEKFSCIIKQRSLDLLEIINDILEISKIESGQLSLNFGACNISILFSELELFFREYQNRTSKKPVVLNFEVPKTANLVIRTDEIKLKQILINLITNAYKFTDSGEIEISYYLRDDFIVFYVSDTGIGISLEDQPRVFERFFQVHHSDKRLNEGNGLGLSIVKGLVELLGGKIWLQSKPLAGSKFFFSIPYEHWASHSKLNYTTERTESFLTPGKTVLVVEDNIYSMEYFKELLSDSGLNILTALNGKEAIKIAQDLPVDLVLLDIRLPDLDGYAVMDMIKKVKPQIKFIAQTAFAGFDEKQKALEHGCIGFITKPVNKQLLFDVLGSHLS